MLDIRLPRPRACSEGQLSNGSSIPDESHPGAHNTDGMGSGLPTSQERGHGGDRPFRNSGTAVYRNIYGSARSPGATDYNLSSCRVPDQWWHHGGDFYFHRDYVFRGAHDYARAGNRYHYQYIGVANNCHGGGGERTSATSAWSFRTSASTTTTATTAKPRQSSSSSACPILQSTTASANGTGARSWT